MHVNAHKTAKFVRNNQHNTILDIINSNNETNNNYVNIDLAKFGIYIKIFLPNSIIEIYYR